MLNIRKSKTPPLLERYRKQPDAVWDGPLVHYDDGTYITFSDVKQELRQHLVQEQKGLCAYCMARLYNDDDIKIEHVLSRKKHPDQALNYKNLVACCNGRKSDASNRKQLLCCDSAKGDAELSFRFPHSSFSAEAEFAYDSEGRIYSIRQSEELEHDLNQTLGLNIPPLRASRKEVRNALIKAINRQFGNQPVKLNWIQNKLDESDKQQLPAFWGCRKFFLQKIKNKLTK